MSDVTVHADIDAPPSAVYDLVADLPRMGEWSPECERVQWIGPVSVAAAGSRFTGHNRNGWRRWSTHGTVTVAERGKAFEFEVCSVFNLRVALWTYRLTPNQTGGCRVTESTRDRRGLIIKMLGVIATGVGDRAARNHQTMRTTLQRLRVAAETQAESVPGS